MRNYLWLFILFLAPSLHAQTHTFCALDQNCAWTGTQTFSMVNTVNAGVFTNIQANEYNQTLLGGINILTEFQAGQGGGTHFPTEGQACGMAVPSGSTVYQANCGADYLTSLSPVTNSVARYVQARAGANNVKVWALNPALLDYVTTPGSVTGANLTNEFDAVVTHVSTTGQLLACSGIFTAQPTNFPCLGINAPGLSGNKWPNGINFAPGAVLNSGIHFLVGSVGNGIGVELDQAAAGNSQNSQQIQFVSQSSGGSLLGALLFENPTGQLVYAGTGGVLTFPNAPGTASLTVVSGTSTLTANAALAGTTAQGVVTTTATGALTTDAIEWSYASAPSAGDAFCIVSAYVTAGNVNFVRTNPTAGAQNVSAIVVNWKILR